MGGEHGAVALLRGVNVGGRNALPMATLRALAASAGLADAQTYIQSGNLVFRVTGPLDGVGATLEAAIAATCGVHTRVAVRTAGQLASVIAGNPFPPDTDPGELHVSFLFAGDAARLRAVAGLAARAAPDEIRVVGDEAYLRARSGLGRSNLAKIPKASSGTTRSWRTVTRLAELADAMAP